LADLIHWNGVKETKNEHNRFRRDLWYKYAQGQYTNKGEFCAN